MKSKIYFLIAIALPLYSWGIVFDVSDPSQNVENAFLEYTGNTITFVGQYTESGKISRVTIDLAPDVVSNTISSFNLPRPSWNFTETSTEVIYSAPNDAPDVDLPTQFKKADNTEVSYTFSSSFDTDHKIIGGPEFIMDELAALPETGVGFFNSDNSLYFEEVTAQLVLRIKTGSNSSDITIDIPSYMVTAVPEPAHATLILSSAVLCLALRRRRQVL